MIWSVILAIVEIGIAWFGLSHSGIAKLDVICLGVGGGLAVINISHIVFTVMGINAVPLYL